jgi:hypothetical protein
MVQGLLTATMRTKPSGDPEVLAREMTFEFTRDVVCKSDDGETVLDATVDAIRSGTALRKSGSDSGASRPQHSAPGVENGRQNR